MIGLLYAIYLIVSVLLLFVLYRTSWQDRLMKGTVIAVLPGVGWLLPMFWPKRIIGNRQEDFEDYVTRQEEEHKVRRIGIYQRIERQQELDVIPIEEALLVSEHKTRRKVIINVLKQDVVNYLEILQCAVSNDDKETSYYAVSAIMEAKRKLQLAMQDLAVKFEQDSTNLQIVSTYAEVLQAYMRSGFLDERTLLQNRYAYLAVLRQLIELDNRSEWPHLEKVEIEMILQMFREAEQSACRYLDVFPHSEDAYLCLMKVYFETKSFTRLQAVLARLKNAPIKLSNNALTMVRFWSEGA